MLKIVETIPKNYIDVYPELDLWADDWNVMATLEGASPKTRAEFEQQIVDAIGTSETIRARWSDLQWAPLLVCVSGDIAFEESFYVGGIDIPPNEQAPSIDRARIMLVVDGDLHCRDLILDDYSNLGVGGNLKTRTMWASGSDGATIIVRGDAEFEYVNIGQQIHTWNMIGSPINIRDHDGPAFRYWGPFLDLLESGKPWESADS